MNGNGREGLRNNISARGDQSVEVSTYLASFDLVSVAGSSSSGSSDSVSRSAELLAEPMFASLREPVDLVTIGSIRGVPAPIGGRAPRCCFAFNSEFCQCQRAGRGMGREEKGSTNQEGYAGAKGRKCDMKRKEGEADHKLENLERWCQATNPDRDMYRTMSW